MLSAEVGSGFLLITFPLGSLALAFAPPAWLSHGRGRGVSLGV